jgi:hypothetical protein
LWNRETGIFKADAQNDVNEAREITVPEELPVLSCFLPLYAVGLLVNVFHEDAGPGKLPDASPWGRIDPLVHDAYFTALPDPRQKDEGS